MRKFVLITAFALVAGSAVAQPLPRDSYPAGTTDAQIAAHEAVRASVRDPSGPTVVRVNGVYVGQDPDAHVRATLAGTNLTSAKADQ